MYETKLPPACSGAALGRYEGLFDGRQIIDRLLEVLMGRALVAVRKRLTLTRHALTGVRAALLRPSVDHQHLRGDLD